MASECHLDRARHVATQQPGLKPGELYHLDGPALLVVCSLHLPKIIKFSLRIQMLAYQQNCSWLHFTWTTLYIQNAIKSQYSVNHFFGFTPVINLQPKYSMSPSFLSNWRQIAEGGSFRFILQVAVSSVCIRKRALDFVLANSRLEADLP